MNPKKQFPGPATRTFIAHAMWRSPEKAREEMNPYCPNSAAFSVRFRIPLNAKLRAPPDPEESLFTAVRGRVRQARFCQVAQAPHTARLPKIGWIQITNREHPRI